MHVWDIIIFTCMNGQNISPVWKERQTESLLDFYKGKKTSKIRI